MADPVDFKALLSKPVLKDRRPPPLPGGHYDGVITNYEYGTSAKKQTPYVRFFARAETPQDDVSPEALSEALNGGDITKRQLQTDFYLTDNARFMLKQFLESCGIAMDDTTTYDSVIPQVVNSRVRMELGIRPDKDGVPAYNDIANMIGLS